MLNLVKKLTNIVMFNSKFLFKCCTLLLVMFNVKVFAVAMNNNFTQESQLPEKYSTEIGAFWQTGQFEHFNGINDKRISYAKFTNKKLKQCLVIVPGRSESYVKYQELAFDLFQHGFNIFIIDHRGQGFSERLIEDQHKGYVEHFDNYADDLNTFVTQVVNPQCQLIQQEMNAKSDSDYKPYLLAHSMGGTIAIRMMQRHPELIKSAVLASPMIAINSGSIPASIAKGIIKTGTLTNRLISDTPWYFLGHQDFQATAFDENDLTSSEVRYQHFIDTYATTPKVQLGGVTFQWLDAAIQAQELIFENLATLTTPITVLQASSDTVVDNDVQNEFCRQVHLLHASSCPDGVPVKITGAKHELFNEKDSYRNLALTHVLAWLK